MKLNERQTLARKRIGKLETSIREAIDKICEEEKFDITYAEINSAMLKVMEGFNGHELRELWKEK